MAIAELWKSRIGVGAKVTEADLLSLKPLLDTLGFKTLMDYLADTFVCPKTKDVSWRNLAYWVDSMDFDAEPSTRRNVDKWRRKKSVVTPASGNPAFTNSAGVDWAAHYKKAERDKAIEEVRRKAKPGSHAEKNPELHTGLNAMGTPACGWHCTVCEMTMTENEDRVCDSCKKKANPAFNPTFPKGFAKDSGL